MTFNVAVLTLLSSIKAAQHQFRPALELAEKALAIKPEDPSALAMLAEHKQRLLAGHPDVMRHKELHVLDIPDDYQRDDPELVRLLKAKVPRHLP